MKKHKPIEKFIYNRMRSLRQVVCIIYLFWLIIGSLLINLINIRRLIHLKIINIIHFLLLVNEGML